MKIAEYIKKNKEAMPPELAELLLNEGSIWTNDACYGYFILAMESAGYDREQIIEVFPHLKEAFEEVSVEEAEKKWVEYWFMTNKDLLIIKKFLSKHREEQKDFERILKYADIDIPLQHLCGENEDAKEVRARVLKQTQEDIAELDRLIAQINDEVINADFECKDGKVYYKWLRFPRFSERITGVFSAFFDFIKNFW